MLNVIVYVGYKIREQIKMVFDIFVILVSLTFQTLSANYYDIPAYYGHFSLRYFQPNFILAGKLVRLEYHFAVDANYLNDTIYYASSTEHCVYQYSVTNRTVKVLVGQCGSDGNIIGSQDLAEFNGVSSVAYFKQPSPDLLAQLQQETVVIVANSSCSLSSDDCILNSPYPKLQMQNLRFTSNFTLYTDEPNQPEYIYLADTNNHCIKKLSLSDNQVTIVAGICGTPGFLDGPLGYNQLNYPTSLGVSREGVVYFFDSGNEYIRIVALDGGVSTLLLGACKELDEGRLLGSFELRQIACYQNWIEGVTQSPTNHYFEHSILNICTSQSSQCASK